MSWMIDNTWFIWYMDWLTPRLALAQSHYIYDTILTNILNDTKRLTRKLSKCYKTLKKKWKWMTRRKTNNYYVNVYWFWFWVLFSILLLPLPLVIKLGYLGEGNPQLMESVEKGDERNAENEKIRKTKNRKKKRANKKSNNTKRK